MGDPFYCAEHQRNFESESDFNEHWIGQHQVKENLMKNINFFEGVGPETPVTTNSNGGSQSAIPYRFDLIDSNMVFQMAKVLAEGAEKYGARNWHKIPIEDHINHALMHLFAFNAGDTQDEHLSHAACRIMFAIWCDAQPSIL